MRSPVRMVRERIEKKRHAAAEKRLRKAEAAAAAADLEDGWEKEIYVDLLENPDTWARDRYTLYKKTGSEYRHESPLQLWIANGKGSFKVYRPEEIAFRGDWADRIWKVYQENILKDKKDPVKNATLKDRLGVEL